ncbi:GlxA family transcriptional regulator [Streptomyces mirabilis]|jgi:Transcriptional regulator containing an amidase domain and an AraC-type DNA-binding HTH domain|uniref:Helix-turn-helix domain-containing protein n=1 Tax=Streptomyces mirabilis TaxID=68239 RepID=A0ABU3V8P3_9ACTN|nr:helix-turn-helix domain-containing protein [Streptomyces mirabilis]MCX4617513.1 helix-turn-helix domain-containing protein [Streptomyces mirabilis]MDU9002129.1 helix-turn-helix domain-containing protein [Streptomyces mirabilis]
MHRVAAVIVPPVLSFDVSIPLMVFNSVPHYDVRVCTARPGPMPTVSGPDIVVPDGLDAIEGADTVIAVGSGGEQAPTEALDALRKAAATGARIASLCTGAFVLAQAGLLDGLRATTHWGLAGDLATRFPSIDVQPDLLFVEDGGIFTSAGAAAAIDLCLHLVRIDYGAAVANTAARLAVVPPVRPGGQSQFIETPLPPERGTSLAPTRAWALEHLDRPLTLADLAGHAKMSVRTLSRRFHAETGLSPLQWLLHRRIDRARELLEMTELPMDQVAQKSGLGSADSLRKHMVGRVGLTPTAYRASFNRAPTGASR